MQPCLPIRRVTGRGVALAGLTVFAALSVLRPARAAERITLTNGFDVVCHHHESVHGRIRLYAKAAQPDYMEISEASIVSMETVPDPVPALIPDAIAQPEQAGTEAGPLIVASEPKLISGLPPGPADAHLTAADLQQMLAKAGLEHNVDEDLLASLVKTESGGNARAVSRAGARGLMQLMPGTARELGVADSFAPEENVRGGTAYFDGLLARYHDNIALALAAYNAGPAAVDRYRGIPPYHETRAYVARVIHEFNKRVAARNKLAALGLRSQMQTSQIQTSLAQASLVQAPLVQGTERR